MRYDHFIQRAKQRLDLNLNERDVEDISQEIIERGDSTFFEPRGYGKSLRSLHWRSHWMFVVWRDAIGEPVTVLTPQQVFKERRA